LKDYKHILRNGLVYALIWGYSERFSICLISVSAVCVLILFYIKL